MTPVPGRDETGGKTASGRSKASQGIEGSALTRLSGACPAAAAFRIGHVNLGMLGGSIVGENGIPRIRHPGELRSKGKAKTPWKQRSGFALRPRRHINGLTPPLDRNRNQNLPSVRRERHRRIVVMNAGLAEAEDAKLQRENTARLYNLSQELLGLDAGLPFGSATLKPSLDTSSSRRSASSMRRRWNVMRPASPARNWRKGRAAPTLPADDGGGSGTCSSATFRDSRCLGPRNRDTSLSAILTAAGGIRATRMNGLPSSTSSFGSRNAWDSSRDVRGSAHIPAHGHCHLR